MIVTPSKTQNRDNLTCAIRRDGIRDVLKHTILGRKARSSDLSDLSVQVEELHKKRRNEWWPLIILAQVTWDAILSMPIGKQKRLVFWQDDLSLGVLLEIPSWRNRGWFVCSWRHFDSLFYGNIGQNPISAHFNHLTIASNVGMSQCHWHHPSN